MRLTHSVPALKIETMMTPVRTNEMMMRDGFMIIPFPTDLSELMQGQARDYIGQATGVSLTKDAGAEELTRAVLKPSDDVFVQKFKKPLRILPDPIAGRALKWVEGLAEFLGGRRAGIDYVSEAERQENPALNATTYDVYWRCVRPGKPDVGQPHADFQFWELHRGTPLEQKGAFDYDERWKIWLPLIGCDKTNSLEVLPGSHTEDVPMLSIETKYGTKPSIKAEWLAANEKRFVCPLTKFSNCAVLFHDKLIHRGPANQTAHLRVSAELTILLEL